MLPVLRPEPAEFPVKAIKWNKSLKTWHIKDGVGVMLHSVKWKERRKISDSTQCGHSPALYQHGLIVSHINRRLCEQMCVRGTAPGNSVGSPASASEGGSRT